jgi:type IV pilus assembly protein PilV
MMRATSRHRAGFTLVEVLLALLVLCVGMLGTAAILLESLRATRSGIARTQAVTLAADLAERILANRATTNAYDCDGPCDAGEGGNAVAIADLDTWRDAVAARLPDGVASVSFVPGAPGNPAVYLVGVDWTDGGAAAQSTYQLRVEIAEAAP